MTSAGTAALYLGLLDGPIKQRRQQSGIWHSRHPDRSVALAGSCASSSAKNELSLPPLSGWVLAFVAVVLIEALNPATHGC